MKKFILLFTIVFMIMTLTSCQNATYYNPKEFKEISKELKKEYKFISKIEMYCASEPAVLDISFNIKTVRFPI